MALITSAEGGSSRKPKTSTARDSVAMREATGALFEAAWVSRSKLLSAARRLASHAKEAADA